MLRAFAALLCALSMGACAAPPATQPAIEAAFSPEAGAEALILRVIDGSQQSIRLAAYAFTSPPVIRALMAAKKRGVDVRLVVDASNGKSKSGMAALNLAVNAGLPARTVATYRIYQIIKTSKSAWEA
jgi:phosphatidylserine/phosphatidylglycerophosphate/cardiolipin synthase-like enzyme